MKYLIGFILASLSLTSLAGGRVTWAVPTQIDIERGNGFMVYGNFGNPGECSMADRFYVKKEHPQYDKIYSAVLSAHASGKEIMAYIHTCEPVLWYSVDSVTYNTLGAAGDFKIR